MTNKLETKCRYFNGTAHNKECKAGINYRNLVGGPDFGWAARLCCVPDGPLRKEPIVKCDKYNAFTDEEILQQEKEISEKISFIEKSFKEIRKISKEKNINVGFIPCPKCSKPLHFNIAKLNGHIWAKCESEGCMQWMQ